ncbi:MAG: helix-turn-helix transcriptional regulator [Bacteroidales bacterium]
MKEKKKSKPKSELPQIERYLKLLLTLSNGVRYTRQEVAERHRISERTVYRDYETLRNAGFAVEQKDGYYWIEKPPSPFKELHELLFFTEEEAWILKRAIHSIDENNLLKQKLVEKLYSLYNFSKVSETIVRREHSENVHLLVKGIETRRQVILHDYHSAHGNSIGDRLIEPFDFSSNFIAVWAFDTKSRSNKLFKTARIAKVSLTNQPFLFPSQHQKFPVDVFRISGPDQIPLRLSLSLRAYNLLIEEYPLSEKFLIQEIQNRWLFDGWVCSYEGAGRFVLGLCDEVEVIAPDDFKDFLKEKLARIENIFSD